VENAHSATARYYSIKRDIKKTPKVFGVVRWSTVKPVRQFPQRDIATPSEYAETFLAPQDE
jgi:hypothetical protein